MLIIHRKGSLQGQTVSTQSLFRKAVSDLSCEVKISSHVFSHVCLVGLRDAVLLHGRWSHYRGVAGTLAELILLDHFLGHHLLTDAVGGGEENDFGVGGLGHRLHGFQVSDLAPVSIC